LTRFTLMIIMLSAVLTACTKGLESSPSNVAISPVIAVTSTTTPTGLQSGTRETRLDLDTLANLEYPLEYARYGKAKLVNGEFREQAAPGSATETIIKLSDFTAFGELNGAPAAAVVLISDAGGSGTFYDLTLVGFQGGKPTILGMAHLGDRVVIKNLQFAGQEIVVEMVTQAEGDPMSNPSQHVRNTYRVEGDRLEIKSSEIKTPAKPTDDKENQLIKTTWQWVRFTNPLEAIEVPKPADYTLEFLDGGFLQIKADCNQATGSYVLEGSALKIEIGPATLAACSPGSLSDQFLKNLGFVRIYFFKEEDLFLDLFADGGTMQFEPGQSSP